MNPKKISKIIEKEVNDWIDSVDDKELQFDLKRNVIVTGGCIVSLLTNEKPKDYDIYFTNKETVKKVTQYYVDKFLKNNKRYSGSTTIIPSDNLEIFKKEASQINIIEDKDQDRIKIFVSSSGVASETEKLIEEPFEDVYDVLGEDDLKRPKYRPIFLSQNAITLSNKIQLVIRFFGEADKIHENYDFVHCTNYWISDKNKLILRPEAVQAILTKELSYIGSKYPLCSVIRTRKFIRKGWSINAGQYLKMLFQLSKLDLTNINVLEDQLTGVDSAYFSSLIAGLKSQQEKNSAFTIGYAYIAKIVDKIF